MPGVAPPLDLFDDSAFDARWKQGERPSDKPAPKEIPKATAWDVRENIIGVLWKPRSPEEICRLTGQLPETVALELCKMEAEGMARRVDGLWQLVRKETTKHD